MAIKDIDTEKPGGNDLVLNGDDEIRDFKTDVKETFPELAGTVYEDADTSGLNGTTPVTDITMSSWEARIKALESLALSPDGTSIPVGGVIAWYGDLNTIPAGFKICDGAEHTYTDGEGNQKTIRVPDLRGRFIMGMGWGTTKWNDTGGLRYTNNEQVRNTGLGGSHTHSVSTPGHSLVNDELASHSHAMFSNEDRSISGSDPTRVGAFQYAAAELTNPSGSKAYSIAPSSSGGATTPSVGVVGFTGKGKAHTHPTTNTGSVGGHVHEFNATQPFCALYYICYVAA